MLRPVLTNISNKVALLTVLEPSIKLAEQLTNYPVPEELDYVIVDTDHNNFWKMMCYDHRIDYTTRKKLNASGRIKKIAAKVRQKYNIKED